MNNKLYLNEYRNTIKANNILKFTLFTLLLVIFVEGFFIIYTMNTQRTVIIPNVKGKYVVSNSSANNTYIQQMALMLTGLMEDFTPSTVKSNYAQFLDYVAPESYGNIQANIMSNAESYIATDTSSFFAPKTIKISSDEVDLIGDKRLIVGNQVVSNQSIKVVIKYTIKQGKFEVLSYEELKNNIG